MDKKIVILAIFMILLISYVYAPETTTTCPANIDVFDYNLIVGKKTRFKAISNKPGKIEIFAKGLSTQNQELIRVKECGSITNGVTECTYETPTDLPINYAGVVGNYYAELTTASEFKQSVTKIARIGDQGNTNNFCADENSIVIGGGVNTPGARCTYAQQGQCNPGYCSRSYSGTGDVSCFYPSNCINNDPLRTLIPLCQGRLVRAATTAGAGSTTAPPPQTTTAPVTPIQRPGLAVREGLSLSTYFNKESGYQGNPAPYSTGDVLTWDYELRNIGDGFSTSICFFLEYPNHNQKDITPLIEDKLNGKDCSNNNPDCTMRLSNIIIGNTAQLFDSKARGNIFTFTFPSSQTDYLPFGQYALIVELREQNSRCSNPDGSIIPASHIEKQINYFNYAGQLRTQSQPTLPCPAVGTTPQAAGCNRIAVINGIIKSDPGITYTCSNPNENCFECSSGQVYDANRYSCFPASPQDTRQPCTQRGQSPRSLGCLNVARSTIIPNADIRDDDYSCPPNSGFCVVCKKGYVPSGPVGGGNCILNDERPCFDSDGGAYPDIKGTIRTYLFGLESYVEDHCINDRDLEELFCTNVNANVGSTRIECPISCKEGHCSQERVACPINGPENPEFVGCRSSVAESSTIEQRYICTESAKNCYKCTYGYVFNREMDRCISLNDPALRLPESCISLKDDLPRDNKLKIAIVGDRYGTDNNLFLRDANAIKDQILSFEPFRELQNKINFYAINPNQDFGCRFDCFSDLPGLPCCTESRSIRRLVAQNCPYNEIIVVINERVYDGGVGPLGFAIFGRKGIPSYVPIHEFGHSFGGLSDEYIGNIEIGHDAVARAINCDDNPQCTKWRDITNSEEGRRRGVGCFEGCMRTRRFYRPIQRHSIMLDITGDFGPVNEKRLRSLLESYR